ncbi:MAG: DNA gyrase inhibitor YacG [Acidobacteriota bacterium]|nr:MAG: DNA gyrase inhibitor YacG [Acidobacteriota bacterium]
MKVVVRRRCPYCRRETSWEDNPWKPFCSERCRTIDLGQWASEGYRIPQAGESGEILSRLENEESVDGQEKLD